MRPPKYTLMPGLHGTSELFSNLSAELQSIQQQIEFELIDYPQGTSQQYSHLFDWINQQLDWSQPRILVAESFSGPLAIQLAKQHPESIKGIVLAASFCHNPAPSGLALLPLRPIFSIRPPDAALRHFLIGDQAEESQLANLREILRDIKKSALSQRLHSVLALEESDCPSTPNTPALILQAQHDNIIPWETQTHIESHFPHAETHWIESPHLILQTNPTACAAAINTWAENL